ncbi:MAG TPA: crossover junction endodeoxyribonuclease RuvC [Armatimonadota bacterium]|nr:crossover junction endodeoxyribonuclease RuvC [Armatimonadota bacterium]
MRIVGIDPGLGCTGYAVVDQDMPSGEPRLVEAGAIRGKASAPLPERLVQLHAEVTGVLEEFRPAAMALEDLYTEYRFPRTALLMAHARGAICLASAQCGIPVWNYAARRVKVAVVGNGAASKEQVQQMVARVFRLAKAPTPNDVSDAMAIALTAHRRGPDLALADSGGPNGWNGTGPRREVKPRA